MKTQAAAIMLMSSLAAFAHGQSLDSSTPQLESAFVTSSFEACSNVKIVENNLTPAQRTEFMIVGLQQKMQRMPKLEFINGLTSPYSIKASLRLLHLTSEKKIENIRAHIDYYQDVKKCLQNPTSSSDCSPLLAKFLNGTQSAIPELRRELALSAGPGAPSSSAIPQLHINAELQSVAAMANPAGGNPLSEAEYKTAVADFAKDHVIVKKHVEEKMAEIRARSNNKNAPLGYDPTAYRTELLRAAYLAQKIEHQAAYKKILLEKPHLAFLPKGSLNTGKLPGLQVLLSSLRSLLAAADEEIAFTLQTRSENRLEFERANGEAFWRSYVKGEAEMLSFITSPVTNEVLKVHPKYCAIAEALLMRVSAKELQNFIITTALFGVGSSAGLTGLGVRGGLHLAKSLGFARAVSIAAAVNSTSNISMGALMSGGAVQLHRDLKHARSDALITARP